MKKYNLGLKNGIKPWSRKQIAPLNSLIRVEISEGVPLKPEIEAQQQIREIFSVLASLTRDMDSVKHTLEQVHCV